MQRAVSRAREHDAPLLAKRVVRLHELIIWRLTRATADRRHGLKYRRYYGRGGKCLVRYDNEAGKGDHRHFKGREEPYRFVSVAKLRRDFEAEIREYGGDNEEED